jgi:site-specific recombinase XerD
VQNELADFLRYCRLERRLADATCKAYERDVRACLAFLREHGIDDLTAVRPPDLRAFLAAEAETRLAVGSQTRTVAALKVFFRFCLENEYLERDPALVLRTPKKREALPDVLDRRELCAKQLMWVTSPMLVINICSSSRCSRRGKIPRCDSTGIESIGAAGCGGDSAG